MCGVIPTLLHPGHTVGDGVDAFGTHWFYWWIRQCVEHFGDPSATTLFFYPDGKDIFADTGNNFVDAVWSVPFQWVFGPTLYQPLFIVVLQLVNVTSFAALARYLWPAGGGSDDAGRTAFVATLLWQVHPYVLFEYTAGRPTQGVVCFLPLAVLYLLKSAREPGLRNAAGLGLSVALAGWTYWFYGYFLIFLLAPIAAWEAARAPRPALVIGRWGLAACLAGLVVAPGALPMVQAVMDGRVPGIGVGGTTPPALANNVEQELHGLWLMETRGAPLFTRLAVGIPLLAALVWPRLEVPGGHARWSVALVVCLVLGLGAGIRLESGEVVGNPFYLAFYAHLPFFSRLWFPYRFAAVAFIPTVILITSLWRQLGARTAVAAVLAVGGLAGQAWSGDWPFRHHDARPPAVLEVLATAPGGVLFLPVGIQHDALMWQTTFQRPMFGGMGESAKIFWPVGYRRRLHDPFVTALTMAARGRLPSRPPTPEDRDPIRALGFRWVVLRLDLVAEQGGLDAPDPARSAVGDVIGSVPMAADERVVVWDLDAPARRTPAQPEGPAAPPPE